MALSSCGKKGCTDTSADNYCDECKKDDGSCIYKGKMVIQWGEAFADDVEADGVTGIKVYVDGEFINTYPTTTYWTSAPNCDANGSITYTKNLGNNKSAKVYVTLKDQDGESIGIKSGSETLRGNTCLALELE